MDDEATALAMRCRVLSSAGYVVLSAADGAAASGLFRCIQVDLVITDHGLPGLTGMQLAAQMKQLKPAIPIVLFSGLPEAPLGSEHVDLVITKGMPAGPIAPRSRPANLKMTWSEGQRWKRFS